MRKILSICAVILFSFCSMVHAADTSAQSSSLKIVVIDLQRIISETPDAKRANKEMHARFEPRHTRILEAQNKLKADVEKLKRDEAIMAESEKNKAQEQILNQQRDLERMQQDFQQDVSLAQRTETDKFLNKVKKVIDQIATKENYDIVLQKNAVPYASNRIDITKQVIDGLNS